MNNDHTQRLFPQIIDHCINTGRNMKKIHQKENEGKLIWIITTHHTNPLITLWAI